ncbi:MAG: hypothetical protein AB8E82_19355 [Aureispira sp.]
MSASNLIAVNKMLYWQRVILGLWGIAWLRQCYWLYDYLMILFDGSVDWSDDTRYIKLLISFVVRIVQVVLYFWMLKEMRAQSILIKQYTNEQSKYNFMLIISSQSQVWKYLTISFLIGLVMMVFYVLENYLTYQDTAAFQF